MLSSRLCVRRENVQYKFSILPALKDAVYIGAWMDGKMHGEGVMTYADKVRNAHCVMRGWLACMRVRDTRASHETRLSSPAEQWCLA